MALTGWRFEGVVPDEPKFVIIVAPHTSNWDFPVGVMALFSLGFSVSFLAKHTVFGWPWGVFMRWLGVAGIALSTSLMYLVSMVMILVVVQRRLDHLRVADPIAA